LVFIPKIVQQELIFQKIEAHITLHVI